MTAYTHDHAKVGTTEYICTVSIDDGDYINHFDSFADRDKGKVEKWGMKRVRELDLTAAEGISYGASIERRRFVESVFEDEEYGTVHDADIEYDESFQCYWTGVTWEDDIAPGGEVWS